MVGRLAWIVAITVGLTAGGFALHFPGSYGEPSWSPFAGIFGLLLGAMNGLFVGALAVIAVWPSRRDGARVLLAMVVIVGVTHAINDGSSTQLPFAFFQAVAGLVAAGTAAWILRERRPTVLAVIGVAWTAGLIVGGWSGNMLGLPLTETGLGWAQDHGWDGLVAGLIWGGATAAIGLPGTIRRRRTEMAPSGALGGS